ncbi:hypothetical protein LV89_03585 [Arcicella aurantiaca]|uniref:Uncharacterized protein n=1 Tax=Arcicella aurantiaca TaxID=591202 RepID=A0A316DX21_9BACT|nr:hypothetical protein [Arcicella aurantiaca]PWK21872.1 hypothetical protein LV89_03585 [Arcicella aurantiaca]
MNLRFIQLFLLTFLTLNLAAQTDSISVRPRRVFNIEKNSFVLPHVWKSGELKAAVGLSSTKFPLDYVESALRIPLIDLYATIGLPKGFDASVNISSIYMANQVRGGLHWNKQGKVFSAKMGYDVGFIFGALTQYGFDNRTSAWSHYPNASIGFKVKDVAITVKSELNAITYINTTAGGIKVTEFKDFFNGGALGVYVEQRLWANHVMIVGCRDNYVKYYYPVWPAFTSFNRKYHNIEFFLGLIIK